MFGKPLVSSVLLALALSLRAAVGHGQAANGSTAEQGRSPAAETLKERLSDKASDDQRVNNCKVPKEKRGTKPRLEECAPGQTAKGNQSH